MNTYKGFEALKSGTHQTTSGSNLSFHYTPGGSRDPKLPVFVFLHGWPQTRYMWRYFIPHFVDKGAVFCPDLPGYGESSQSQKGADRLTVGGAVLEAVAATYGNGVPVVLITHDRGSRIGQALCSHRPEFPDVDIRAAVLIDIVPYVAQWAAMATNPKAAVGYFHWSLLPHPSSTQMIKAYGAGQWVKDRIMSVGVNDAKARELLSADGALEHYAAMYEKDEVMEGARQDYLAGATVDFEMQREDKAAGRLVDVPILALYSANNLAKVHDVPAVWKEWVKPGMLLVTQEVNCGHHIPEEAPEDSLKHTLDFIGKLEL